MGNSPSQTDAASRPSEKWRPFRLCGTMPTEVVPAEHYVQQLWEALDMTHQMAECGIGSDTPVGQGGTLDTVTLTIRGANAPMSVKTPPPPGVPPPPDYLPEMEDELIVKNTVKALSPRIVAVHGPTGTGKSTVFPLAIAHWAEKVEGLRQGLTLCAQPRRILCQQLCERVRSNRKMDKYDKTVGYKIARDSSRNTATKLLYCTEAIVAMMMQQYLTSSQDPSVQEVITTVIIDEVHNRSAHSDYVLALTLAAMQKVKHLRLVLMSATGDHSLVTERIPHCQQLVMKGVMHHVKRCFLEQPLDRGDNLLNQMAQIVITFHNERVGRPLVDETCRLSGVNESNKFMVFLPGLPQIYQFCEILQRAIDLGWTEMLIPLPFHGQSPSDEVQAVFTDPSVLAETNKYPLAWNPNLFDAAYFEEFSAPVELQRVWNAHRDSRFARSCIVCTNVAESGITIPNVGVVISSGVQRRVSTDVRTGVTVNAFQTLSKAQLLQQLGRSGRTDCGIHITMMSRDQYTSQVRSADLAQLEESDISPMILRSLTAGRSFSRLPFLCPPHPMVQTHAKEKMFLHGILDTKGVTRLGHATACMDLPCEWAQFLYTCAERGLEDSALILIAIWHRQGTPVTQQFNLNHGHPDGDLVTCILAYHWFLACRRTHSSRPDEAASQEWAACAKVGLIHHILVAIHDTVMVLRQTFTENRQVFPEVPPRNFGSPGYTTLLLHAVWTSFYDRCLIKLPTGEYVSPQFGGSWTLESSSLCHNPMVIIALNRTIRDGASYASCLTPIPEEWLVERDWFIVNHWEDKFCRDAYQDLCSHAEFQHLRALALLSPGTTPQVCPVDSLVNTSNKVPNGDTVTVQTLSPCSWRYVLSMDDLASLRLKARSDVVSAWEITATNFRHFYGQVKLKVVTQCFTPAISKSGATYRAEKSDKVDSEQIRHTRTLLLPSYMIGLNYFAFNALKKDTSAPRGAAKAYRESQTRIYKMEAPLYLGVGEGIDSLDFHADLSALKAIQPDETNEGPSSSQPVPRSSSPLLQKLKQGETMYAYCAWCSEALPTRQRLEDHYYAIHHVILQPSCCAPPSVFQTIMGKELQLRQKNFASFSVTKLLLSPLLSAEAAKDVLGASCSVMEDKSRIWHVRMPDFRQARAETADIVTPDLHWLADEEADMNDYLADPLHPVLCLPGPDDIQYWDLKGLSSESIYGEPGSTRNFWQLSMHSQRLTLGMKMKSTAAFLSMPNANGIIMGGPPDQGFNDNSARGYPAWMPITTRQVTDVVMNDQDILAVKGGRQVAGPEPYMNDMERLDRIRQVCASRYLSGYPVTKVIDPLQVNYPACTMPLAATAPLVITAASLCTPQYVCDYVKHVGLIREMLGHTSLSENPAVLAKCNNKLLNSIAGLLQGSSNCPLNREPIPAWSVVKVVRTKPTAELVAKTTLLMVHDETARLNMPCAPMPIPDTDETSAMHPALVTALTASKPHYRLGGLIPHLSREGCFWKSTRPAVHETIVEHQLSMDPVDPTYWRQVDRIVCGWTPSLSKANDYNPNNGLHKTLSVDCLHGNPHYWLSKDGTTAKAASPAGPPSWSGSVRGLTQQFEQMSMKGGTQPSDKTFLDEAFEPAEELHLNHEEVRWEFYTGRHFEVPELIAGADRFSETRLKLNALGGDFHWTLNHEVVFSSALTGRPKRKSAFSQYCWKRCAVGTTEEYGVATSKREWEFALMNGDLHGLQVGEPKETMVLCPWNNTEYLNVAAYLEAFWGFIWPAVCHQNVPPHDEWTSNLHGGLKEFIDHAINVLGRTHLKPTTECLRGVVTYPTGESTQGRFKMNLMDLQNKHYTVAVREAMMELLLGRSDKDVQVGDIVEMLLSISFGVKDSMLDWTWLGINPKEWPPQRLDWEVYRLEHLSFASNMEESMTEWINYPWHVVYSALRCMACQDWKKAHDCPVCGAARNGGGSHDAWSYFSGCLAHLDSTPKCIGALLRENPLHAKGKSLIPSVATMLRELSPEKQARDWLPPMTILYMAPGGHRQWPVSIKPMLDRLSWIVKMTRPQALESLREALRTDRDWKPQCRQSTKIEPVPAVPYKFLDIGTKMGEYHLEDLALKRSDKENILHPRYCRSGIPPTGTFQSIVRDRVVNRSDIIHRWCNEEAWFEHSPTWDFRVVDEAKYRWGLPVLVPTCPRKLFMQGPRLKYVDIVTDTQHASSSDLITWNTLVMMKLRWLNVIPRKWVDITVNSLEAWNARDLLSQFHPDTRRGYARVIPVALSHIGVPESCTLPVDDFPKDGLGVYDDYETCGKFSGYIWATWTTMIAQPMQVNAALQALLNPTAQASSSHSAVTYDLGVPSNVDHSSQPVGSSGCASGLAAPFPDSTDDAIMESGTDKRSRESPDSTLKPEGKSLKTSEKGATPANQNSEEVSTADGAQMSNVTKRPKTVPEAKSLMQEVHLRHPAWKAVKLLEAYKSENADLVALGEATGILFESQDVFKEAVGYLENLRKDEPEKEDADLGATDESDSHSTQPAEQEVSQNDQSNDRKDKKTTAASTEAAASSGSAGASGDASNQVSTSSSSTTNVTSAQQDATASTKNSDDTVKTDTEKESHKDWFKRVIMKGQDVLWPSGDPGWRPTLLTGVHPLNLKELEALGWEDKLESANLDNHVEYLRGRNFLALPHPLEATAWENGFVPETHGLPSNEIEPRLLSLLPQLSHMVSAPRQPIDAGDALLPRFDANVRPYWLRDWQSGFGGYTKVYEYQCGDQIKRVYSVAHVVRPRTPTTEACLCFSLMKTLPTSRPWKREAGQKDPSRSILLDLEPYPDWKVPATVLDPGSRIALELTDDQQVQCLPVAKSTIPKWTYRKLPKVTAFRVYGRLPAWGRKPQKMVYQLCAENITKHDIVPNLPEDEKEALQTRGALPSSSSARDRHCVMCPVRRGSPRLLPCALCYNWCHPGCSYQTHLGRICPCHVRILDPKRKIMVLKHPYHEDLVILPTRPNLRLDTKSVSRDARLSSGSQHAEAPSKWSASLWINTLLEKHAWLSAGLVWLPGASQSADIGAYKDPTPEPLTEQPTSRPVISLFEHWEEGTHLPVALNARDFAFPPSLVVPYVWSQAPQSLSLHDALNYVSTHGEKQTWGQASLINLVPGSNYPNQPDSNSVSHLSDPLTYWWGVTLCPPELNDVALAENVVILMRIAAMREMRLSEEVNKPSIANVLEFKGDTMDCCVESTPSEEAYIYASAYDGGELLKQFGEPAKMNEKEEAITRSHGEFASTDNPWQRKEEQEAKEVTEMQRRRPGPSRRQGNRWDQYGESSSASPSETHGMSDNSGIAESTWGPWEAATKSQRAAQPYRLQKANKSDGLWSRWASDARQSLPDQWSDSSAKWASSAGDDSSWRQASEWERSSWTAPTKWTLKGSDYDMDREWHSQYRKYGEGWAYDSSQSRYKRAKPTWTDPEDDRRADPTLPIGSTSKTYDPQNDYTMWQRRDSNQYWKQAASSGDQWRPRLRSEAEMSSVAGDTSDASAAVHRLNSINEHEGDAVRDPRSDARYRW